MPTLAQMEEQYDCPAYCSWSRVPPNLKTRKWFSERGVKIPARTKPDGVKGQYGSYIKFFLYDANCYELEFFYIYEIWAYRSKTEIVHLFSGKDNRAVLETMSAMRENGDDFLLYELREGKFYPVKKSLVK